MNAVHNRLGIFQNKWFTIYFLGATCSKIGSQTFLKKFRIFSHVNDIPSLLENNVLKQYFPHKKVESVIPSRKLKCFITDYFGMDQELVQKALQIHEEKAKLLDYS
ncbi:hypothetical protein [Bacillus manliponensis]|uniref:hypothetical protein n=1 Tax=Bacillus manliponensis TaxID=574376 RepID=UPI0035143874